MIFSKNNIKIFLLFSIILAVSLFILVGCSQEKQEVTSSSIEIGSVVRVSKRMFCVVVGFDSDIANGSERFFVISLERFITKDYCVLSLEPFIDSRPVRLLKADPDQKYIEDFFYNLCIKPGNVYECFDVNGTFTNGYSGAVSVILKTNESIDSFIMENGNNSSKKTITKDDFMKRYLSSKEGK